MYEYILFTSAAVVEDLQREFCFGVCMKEEWNKGDKGKVRLCSSGDSNRSVWKYILVVA